MDIFEFAMQMELDGAKLYRQLADASRDSGMKSILEQLARDEDKHYGMLKRMSESGEMEMSETTVLSDAMNIFAKVTVADMDLGGEQVDVYRRAAEIEKRSEDFYLEKADEVEQEGQKQLLLRIADEEKRHRHLLEGMVEFLERPQVWLENAEFNQLEDY